MNIRNLKLKRLGLSIAACCAAVSAQLATADAVTDWNANIGEVAQAACISPAASPFYESRLYAMVHLAVHDALNAIERRSTPYARRTERPARIMFRSLARAAALAWRSFGFVAHARASTSFNSSRTSRS